LPAPLILAGRGKGTLRPGRRLRAYVTDFPTAALLAKLQPAGQTDIGRSTDLLALLAEFFVVLSIQLV
jgi:hypothetical protein